MDAQIVEKIGKAVADSKDVDPMELDYVLEDHVDTDAIRRLAKHENSTWTLTFELPDCTVIVTSSGEIIVNEIKKETFVIG